MKSLNRRETTRSTPVALKLQDVERNSPWETLRRGHRLISSQVGLIKQMGHGVYHAQDPQTFALGIMASDLSRYTDILNSSKGGGGSEVLEEAIASTIGEAVERYAMLFYDKSQMVFAPYREIEEVAVSPDLLRLYSREQVQHFAQNSRMTYFDTDSPVCWQWAYSLTHGASKLVPACQVYMNYHFDPPEALIGRNASTGLAAALTLEEAILTALNEVIERDAFAISWLHGHFKRRIEVDDPELHSLMVDGFQARHPKVDIKVYEITLDIPLTCSFLIMRRPFELGPALCVGTASRLTPKAAVNKCMREAGQALPYFRYLMAQLKDWEPKEDFSDITSFDHHCVLYLKRPELVDQALAFTEEVGSDIALSRLPDRSTGRVKSDIETCVQFLQERGYEVLVSEITTPDVEEIGFRAVRVMVPGLVPLHGNHNAPFLGVRRLHEIPYDLGWEKDGWKPEAGLNQYPHPFP